MKNFIIFLKKGETMAGSNVIQVDDTNFKNEILESTLPVLVDFWAEWCGPCRMIAPLIEEFSIKYADRLKVCKVNVDSAPQSAVNYGIMSIPTLMLFNKSEIKEKIVGAVPKDIIISKIEAQI
ncbi:thioredoxin [Candidatus Omnitrophus magneticus]|uniref:Thioredoxin n=1 Tax=Candidatus Omnitrophus magneticus TaxID=1609969 RepID=A0A0F0CUL3_9BACT|nr:thioredoxin [Candidatus Omnitrophus magneticus]